MKCFLPILLMLFILHGIVGISLAATNFTLLPRTGQTLCYNNSGGVISCAGTGQDGDKLAGTPWPTPRFMDNADGTVTDNLTGLIWLKNAQCAQPSGGITNASGVLPWKDALIWTNNLSNGVCGLTDGSIAGDWRMPNRKEMQSLVDRQNFTPALPIDHPFTGNLSSETLDYWTSSTDHLGYMDYAMLMELYSGFVLDSGKNYSLAVWPVRDGNQGTVHLPRTGQVNCWNEEGALINCAGTGQDGDLKKGATWPTPRFTNNGNGTVTDNLTGLIWLQNAKCTDSSGGITIDPVINPYESPGSMYWNDALAWANALSSGTCGLTDGSVAGDWRLPNIVELESLVDIKYYAPPIEPGYFDIAGRINGVGTVSYWSSSTYARDKSMAWIINLDNGGVRINEKGYGSGAHVWTVRGGQYVSVPSLTIIKTGSGTVTSSPAGINCGSTCNSGFTAGQSVTLTATSDSGYAFASWTGCDSSSDNQCTVVVNSIKSVTATFLPTTACGSANGGSFSTAPTANLCAAGTASTVTTTGTAWNWSCTAGTDPPAKCSASIPMDPAIASIQLPQTGQTVCYEPTVDATPWAVIPCAGTGQDGEIQAGKPWPTPRFTDNGDGTVTDNLTGLVWLKNVHCTDSSGGIMKQPVIVNGAPGGWLPWADSLTWSNNLSSGTCGLTDSSLAGDWRLPNVTELASLQDASQNSEPALPTGHFFGNAWPQFYQSSTTYALASNKEGQWVGDIFHGGIHNWGKSDNVFLWPVRDGGAGVIQLPRTGQTGCWNTAGTAVPCAGTGQDGDKLRGAAWPSPRFTNNFNGTVTDRLTGLIWLKDANCLETSGGIVKSGASLLFEAGSLSWPDALTWSRNLGSGICKLQDGSSAGDWRLPNKNELQSLMDRQNYGPTLPTEHPFLNVGTGIQARYWSSTPTVTTASVFPRNLVWTTSMLYGFDGPDFINYTDLDGIVKMFNNFVWPVRGGSFGDSAITVAPGSKDFGALAVGGSAGQVLTISNSGATSRLQVSAMTLYGADPGQFALSVGDGYNGTCGSTMPIIPPGSSCTITVSFYPTNTGAKSASLRIFASDVNTPNTDIPLSGTALINGDCGAANSGTFNTAPAANLCTSGTPSTLTGTGPWNWNCNGAGGGTSDSCSANITRFAITFAAGTNGSLTGTTSQTINYGGSATTVTATADPTYAFVNWTEGSTVVGTNAALTVSNVTAAHNYTANFVVNYGVCGTSNGGTFTSAPASNHCAAGTATALSGSGPWGWKCVSKYGGADADCSANIATYTVTPSADALSTVSPVAPFSINHGSRTTFTVIAPAGYGTVVSGCGGTLSGTTYTSGPITGNCTVSIVAVARNANGSSSGQPSMQDAMKALNVYNGKPQSTADIIRYDVAPLGSNGAPVGNGVVDFADVILILRRIVGLGSW